LQALEKEYQTAQKEFQKAYKEGKTPADKQKAVQEKYPQPDKFAARFLELAEKNPKDPVAVDALVWVVSNTGGPQGDAESPRTQAMKLLLRDHIQSEKMAIVCQSLRYAQGEDSRKLTRAVLEKNPHRSVQAQACLALATQIENRLRTLRRFKDRPEMAKHYETILGKQTVEAILKSNPDKLTKEAEKLYEQIAKQFADVADERGGTLGKMAEQKLEALRHPILVGKPAPDIDGEDIDGTKFKLSDYRGKVVLLDFWGNW
jgi:hypothetical protein